SNRQWIGLHTESGSRFSRFFRGFFRRERTWRDEAARFFCCQRKGPDYAVERSAGRCLERHDSREYRRASLGGGRRALCSKKEKEASVTRETLAISNPVAARGVAVMALTASLAMLGACAGDTNVTSNVIADGGSGGSAGNHPDGGDAGAIPLSCDNAMLVLEN